MPDPAMSEPVLELRAPLDGKALGSRKDGAAIWLAALPQGAVLHVLAPPASATAMTTELTALGASRSLTLRAAAPGQWYLLGDSELSAADISALRTALAGKADILDQSHARARILVGVKPLEPKESFRAGAHILKKDDAARLENDQGHVTSTAFSPELGHQIGLALVRHGPERHGEEVVVWNALRGEFTRAVLCAPCFIDPENARLHA